MLFIIAKCTAEYFLGTLFLFESTIRPVNNRKYFFQMAASAGHTVSYSTLPIFKNFIDCVQLFITNDLTNIVLQKGANCLWFVGLTLIFDGASQIIVQRCQIVAPRWPTYISSAIHNMIFKNRAQSSSVASSVWYLSLRYCRYPTLQFW